jgi:hypothetical protein
LPPRSIQRSKSSTFARLTRSVSKLGSGRSARAAQQAAAAAAAAVRGGGAAPPGSGHRRVGSSEGVGGMGGTGGGGIGGTGSSAAPRSGKSAGLGDFAAGSAARIKLFEAGHFNLETDLGSLTGGGRACGC